MILCLSARMFTVPGKGDEFELNLGEFIKLAKDVGYDGITLRRGQLDERNTEEEVQSIKELLHQHEAACSFVTGKVVTDEQSYGELCKIIDYTAIIGCRYVQPAVRSDGQIPWMQKCADYAKERGVFLAPQMHNATMFETVDRSLQTLKKIDRENFGVTFEGSHLIIMQQSLRNGDAVKKLAKHIFAVCVQNYKEIKETTGDGVFSYGGAYFKPCLPGDSEGVDLQGVFGALKEIGFDGFVTFMAGPFLSMENRVLCELYNRELRKLM